jgi:malate dehydrogenase (oxaloacetate-decarboxylating)
MAEQEKQREGFHPQEIGEMIARRATVRFQRVPGTFGRFATRLGEAGAVLGDIRTVDILGDYIVRGVTFYAQDEDHLEKVLASMQGVDGAEVLRVQDHILEMHIGGKLEMVNRVPIRTLNDLRTVYTPGVAQVCLAIKRDPTLAYTYTHIWNSVAVVTNGTAILGLGDIGPIAGMPVMEGKGSILRDMVGISPIPILMETHDPKEIIETVFHIAPTFGCIQLEDIAAPECFEIERELTRRLDRGVFHDDQHGTAVVVMGALFTALKRLERAFADVKIVISGAGAAGIAITRMLMGAGAKNIILVDRSGAIYDGRTEHMNSEKADIAKITNPAGEKGSLADCMKGAHVLIGVSSPGLVNQDMVRSMAPKPVVYALANPDPEIDKRLSLAAGAAYATDGRTLNNALAFPGIFRGALDARATCINDEMKLAAARMICELTPDDALVPDFMQRSMHGVVAAAVRDAAMATGCARITQIEPSPFEQRYDDEWRLAGESFD